VGHMVNTESDYRLLQRKMDNHPLGAPYTPDLMKILRLIYPPDDAAIAKRIPMSPTSLDVLSRRLGMPSDKLRERLTRMAERGALFDLEYKGQTYFSLPPVVVGFFENTFIRKRDDVPMAELARLFDEYLNEDVRFMRSLFQRQTQVFRPLVHEEAIPEKQSTEVLDWERASSVVASASAIAVGLCQCHHIKSHQGSACEKPQEVCLQFNYAADMVIRLGQARPITAAQAMHILEDCKQKGLAQLSDNVQHKVVAICNCCTCCCHVMRGIKDFKHHGGVFSSNWTAQVDLSRCNGCGRCAKTCPMEAISVAEKEEGGKVRKWAVLDPDLCLGCGVCYSVCKPGGITMTSRDKRMLTPETVFDKLVMVAMERGRLANLIFDDPERLNHRVIGRLVSILEKSPPSKAAMAIEPLRSAFLSTIVNGWKKRSGELSEYLA
jgi:ferredoxin